MSCSKPVTKNRVVILDAMNIMHGWTDPVYFFDEHNDPRPKGMLLLQAFYFCMKEAHYTFAAIFKKDLYRYSRDIASGWVIEELDKLGLIKYPEDAGLEADDRCAIRLAEKLGGVIVTNDCYRNHREDFPNFDFENRLIRFTVVPNQDFNLRNAQKTVQFFAHFTLDPSFEKKSVVSSENAEEFQALMDAIHSDLVNPTSFTEKRDKVHHIIGYLQHQECVCLGIESIPGYKEYESKVFPFKDYAVFMDHLNSVTQQKTTLSIVMKDVREALMKSASESSFNLDTAVEYDESESDFTFHLGGPPVDAVMPDAPKPDAAVNLGVAKLDISVNLGAAKGDAPEPPAVNSVAPVSPGSAKIGAVKPNAPESNAVKSDAPEPSAVVNLRSWEIDTDDSDDCYDM